MKRNLFLVGSIALSVFSSVAKADFGDATFPVDAFKDGPKSYHDAFCRDLKNKCRVRFQGPAMWVEGKGGIQSSQYIRYRSRQDAGKGGFFEIGVLKIDYYNYITYRSKTGEEREALFIFTETQDHSEFLRAFLRWKNQESKPIPNYRLPASQGPQDTQGRDKGLNPYKNPPILDWFKRTTTQ